MDLSPIKSSSVGRVQFLGATEDIAYNLRDGSLNQLDLDSGAIKTFSAPKRVFGRFKIIPGEKQILSISDDPAKPTLLELSELGGINTTRVLCRLESYFAPFSVSDTGEFMAAVCWSTDTVPFPKRAPATLYIWRRSDLVPKLIQLREVPDALRFSPDDSTLLAVGTGVEQVDLKTLVISEWQQSTQPYEYSTIAFAPDGKTVVLGRGFRNMAVGIDVWYDWKGSERKRVSISGISNPTNGLEVDSKGHIFANMMDGNIIIADLPKSTILAALTTLSDGSWAAVTPEGWFDARADAIRWMGWRLHANSDFIPADVFFSMFYYPGLLSAVGAGTEPVRPAQTIAEMLDIPGLDTMLAARLISLGEIGKRPVLCLPTYPSPDLLQSIDLTFNGTQTHPAITGLRSDHPEDCEYYFQLPGLSSDYELSAPPRATREVPAAVLSPTVTTVAAGATVHIQAVAYNGYHALGTLPYPSSDGKKFSNFFENEAFKGRGAPHIKVWPQLGDKANATDIRIRLHQIAAVTRPQDVVVLLFSGHGVVLPGQQMYFFLPASLSANTRSAVEEEGFNSAMFADALRDMKAKRLFLVVDSCQAGGSLDSLARVGQVLTVDTRDGGPPHAEKESWRPGVLVVTAATPFEEAVEKSGLGHGFLVEALLDAIRSDSGDTGKLGQHIKSHLEKAIHKLPLGERPIFSETPEVVTSGTPFELTNLQHRADRVGTYARGPHAAQAH
jgi:hypothetical protein